MSTRKHPFPQSIDEYITHEFEGLVLLSVKRPSKARIEVHVSYKLVLTFFSFQAGA